MWQKDYKNIKFWYNKQVDELAKDRWFDGQVLPMRLMDDFGTINQVERNEFMLCQKVRCLHVKSEHCEILQDVFNEQWIKTR